MPPLLLQQAVKVCLPYQVQFASPDLSMVIVERGQLPVCCEDFHQAPAAGFPIESEAGRRVVPCPGANVFDCSSNGLQ